MTDISLRKSEHLRIVTEGRGAQDRVPTGLDLVRFRHCALPELDFDAIDLGTTFLGRELRAPLLISAMTGGPVEAGRINAHIAEACQELRIALSVGSQRIAVEHGDAGGLGRELRRAAPDVPILGNIGAVQLNYAIGIDEARRAVDMIEADALILHLNPLQEAIQPGGDRNFSGLLTRIEELAHALPVPIGAKEVGSGLSASVIRSLGDAGVRIFDVAGTGGTSWARVEAERGDAQLQAIAAPFHDWGIPTADALRAAAPLMGQGRILIGSGGIRHGLDVARAIRLGADIAGQAAGALSAARTGTEALVAHLSDVAQQLRIAMFCTGSADLAALRRAPLQEA
ncbi:type 2 isopentenyl-diphosphate Delta-isomerase [Paracoccus sp. 1_MG-2023]|uniref:type 2 isopentenyl-diphosphate Delta-isomerase n=1 Tax=unclassified Paracoccus (in: a-proteobacteria) TaxID=2688777 RepID=UPI001C091B12|nr:MULTISPECIES: type 2 isopentenyl-diphosphate Delta-isomerase [unclassified Paracoccus (in: a-proteobacteria)]MBU2958715.1 type 2 isopentenyl-diphosphate Delta-isomerase [Paracoccus sp. C2R09]MDO6667708.1 type 2 isopentenyl-diphosphate Delta-isomerase [Paracoccus sp. 1_MG-2023]